MELRFRPQGQQWRVHQTREIQCNKTLSCLCRVLCIMVCLWLWFCTRLWKYVSDHRVNVVYIRQEIHCNKTISLSVNYHVQTPAWSTGLRRTFLLFAKNYVFPGVVGVRLSIQRDLRGSTPGILSLCIPCRPPPYIVWSGCVFGSHRREIRLFKSAQKSEFFCMCHDSFARSWAIDLIVTRTSK